MRARYTLAAMVGKMDATALTLIVTDIMGMRAHVAFQSEHIAIQVGIFY